MKQIVALLALIFMLPALALSAITLPDYQKDGKVTGTWVCYDKQGQTITREYRNPEWRAFEIATAFGDILIYLQNMDGEGLFMKRAGSSEMVETTFEEFDPVFKELAPEAHKLFTEEPNNCEKKK